jgi:NAD(P)-dependent dehydrogenase (short-subunit alcohol dehydrogenase family)
MSSFNNQVVIITGCSSGIGLATTLLFLDRHARVFGIDISPFQKALTTGQEKAFSFHQANLTEDNASEDAVAACIAKYGRIDVLVNCAGISDGWSSADTLQDKEWERVMAVNLTVPIRLMRAVLPSMKEQKSGSIVNVASKAGVSGASSGIAYTASKHGLVIPCIFPNSQLVVPNNRTGRSY